MNPPLDEFCETCNAAFEPTEERPYWCSWTCHRNIYASRLPVIGAGAEDVPAFRAEHGGSFYV